MSAPITLERLLVDPSGFDLPTASPLQLAVTRAADGRPIGADLTDDEVRRHFGCERSQLGLVAPVLMVIVAGVRGGKSFLAACAAVKGCLTADLSRTKRHEIPRFAIIAPTVDNAEATFRLLVGAMQASPKLSRLIVGEPTADTLMLRRPDGRTVEIVVVAASRGAVTVRSRWLVGFVLDEVALFGSEPTGAVINAEELLRGAETRLVPGAQGWLISSPYGPQGLLWELYKAHFGTPGRVVVVHAPTRAMNPSFPAEQVDAIRAREPDVAAREYDAAWVDAAEAFFHGPSIDAAVRASPLVRPPVTGGRYVAAWDAGTRGNSWTLVVARNLEPSGREPRIELPCAMQWTGSKTKPLDPEATIKEIGAVLAPYGVREVLSDSWSADALGALAKRYGFAVREWAGASRTDRKHEMYRGVGVLLSSGRLELPDHPVLKNDLKLVRRKATANGVAIDLPKTPDGRHCDFAPAVVLAAFFAERTPARGGYAPGVMLGGASRTWVDAWSDEARRPDAFNF